MFHGIHVERFLHKNVHFFVVVLLFFAKTLHSMPINRPWQGNLGGGASSGYSRPSYSPSSFQGQTHSHRTEIKTEASAITSVRSKSSPITFDRFGCVNQEEARSNDLAEKRRIAAIRRQAEEQEERTAFLALHSYAFERSSDLQAEFADLQAAIEKDAQVAKNRTFFEYCGHGLGSWFFTDPNVLTANKLAEKAAQEQKLWESKTLQKIKEDDASTASFLALHQYVFKPSLQAAQDLQVVESAIKAKAESWLNWLGNTVLPEDPLYVDPNIKIHKDAIFAIEQERVAWHKQMLQQVSKKIEQEKLLAEHRDRVQVSTECVADMVQTTYQQLKMKFIEEQQAHIQDIQELSIPHESYTLSIVQPWLEWIGIGESAAVKAERISHMIDQHIEQEAVRIESELRKAQIDAEKLALEKITESLHAAAIKNHSSVDTLDTIIDAIEANFDQEQNLDSNMLFQAADGSGALPTMLPASSSSGGFGSQGKKPDEHQASNTSGSIESYQVQNVTYQGKPATQFVYIDARTNTVLGDCIVPHDGSPPMFTASLQPGVIQNKNIESLQKVVAQHDAFSQHARAVAHKRDFKSQIQNIAYQYRAGYLTAEQAYQKELEVYRNSLVLQDQKDVQKKVKEDRLQEQLKKKLAKACRPSYMQRIMNYLAGRQAAPSIKSGATGKSVDDHHMPATDVQGAQNSQSSTAVVSENSCDTVQQVSNVPPVSDDSDTDQKKSAVQKSFKETMPEHHAFITDFVQSCSGTTTPSPSFYQSQGNHADKILEQDAQVQAEQLQKSALRQQLILQQQAWSRRHHVHDATAAEQAFILQMQDAIALADNDTTIEFAQSSLQAWADAQGAQTDEAYQYHRTRSKKLHDAATRKSAMQSMYEPAISIQSSVFTKLTEQYEPIVQIYNQEKKSDTQTDRVEQSEYLYAARIAQRLQALAQSKQQIISQKLVNQSHALSSQARGFMMAHNINYTAFDGMIATDFQHCLAQELLGIIEQSASLGLKTDSQSMIGRYARYTCDLAVTAQQLNQSARLEQAVAVTDLSQFFALYGQTMLADDGFGDAQACIAIGQGAWQALLKWHEFAKKIGHKETRSQTIGEIAHNCKAIGNTLYNIAAAAYEFSPAAYGQDLHDAITNYFQQQLAGKHPEPIDAADLVAQRVDRNLQTLHNCYTQSLQTAQIVVQEMMKNSAQQNIANATEICVDGWITDKVTHLLGKLCQSIGDQVLQAGQHLVEQIPSHLQNSSFHKVQTSAGTFDLLADATGESISAASAAQIAANNAEKIASNIAKAQELSKKLDELTKPDPAQVQAFEKSIEPYLNSEKVIDVKRLQSIEGVEQIKKYKDFTNNFHPDGIAKLKPEEILHLNLCDWLEPQARKINTRLKEIGGIKIIDLKTGIAATIEELDLFHSLLGEVRPGSIRDHTKGGHLCIVNLKASLFEISEIQNFGNGFFDMKIAVGSNSKVNSFFPLGTSVEQSVQMIENIFEDIIKNSDLIKKSEIIQRLNGICISFEIENKSNQVFKFYIEQNKLKFFPLSPFSPKKS